MVDISSTHSETQKAAVRKYLEASETKESALEIRKAKQFLNQYLIDLLGYK